MWHFSTQGLPPSVITATGRELLPPVFTLICQRQTVIFCGTICFRLNGTRLFTGAMLYAVRTFLVVKRARFAASVAALAASIASAAASVAASAAT